jgi:hypothetical protein
VIDRPTSRPCLLTTIVVASVATLLLGLLPAGPMEVARLSFLTLR